MPNSMESLSANEMHYRFFDNNAEDQIEEYWKVLIVDDEVAVHSITEIALKKAVIFNRKLQFLHAYSEKDAKKIISTNSDIAIILLDVVMEKDDAGLTLVKFIRNQMKNQTTRIVICTGQPGMAPELDVVKLYDINDYKEKTELTSQKLHSIIFTAMRAYIAIVNLEQNQKQLKDIIKATSKILEKNSLTSFAHDVLEQVSYLLHKNDPLALAKLDSAITIKEFNQVNVLARSGQKNNSQKIIQDEKINESIEKALESKCDIANEQYYAKYFCNKDDVEIVLCINNAANLNESNLNILDIFYGNVTVAIDNLRLNQNLLEVQKELVYKICELAETRSKETGNHVRRVAHYSKILGEKANLNELQTEKLFFAAPLHDVGKIGISDAILNKPGKLTDAEWEIMQAHTTIGSEILQRSKQPVLKAGAIIAAQHHENWDGSGYPKGLSGKSIHIYGRIVAIADVFDALACKRCYKEPWAITEIDTYIKDQSGKKFDPELVEIYLNSRDQFLEIFHLFSDSKISSHE